MPTSAELLHHEITGDIRTQTPVFLLRPIAGTVTLWHELISHLSRRRPVIACDARGVGKSPPARVPTSTRTMAEDAAQLIEALGLSSVHVFGLSLGGMVATHLAAIASERVVGLVLGSTPATGLALARSPLRKRAFATCLLQPAGDREACLAAHALSGAFRAARPQRTAAILDEVRREGGSLRTLALHASAGGAHDGRQAAAQITAATLCIAGDIDDLVERRDVEQLARVIRGARTHVLPGVGHDLSLEAPEALATLIADHCDAAETVGATRELVFVYNADGGVGSKLLDAAHKLLSPSTYACSLCALTYGAVSMRRAWSRFLATLTEPVRFLYRDQLAAGLRATALPALFERRGGRWRVLLDKAALDACPDLDTLIARVRAVSEHT